MKVAYVLRYYPTLSETFVVDEIRQLLRMGHSVEIVAIGRRADGRFATGLPAVAVHRPGRRASIGSWARRLSSVDHVHAHFDGEASRLAQALANWLKRPWSLTLHASDLFKPHPGIVSRLRSADGVVTVCEHHRGVIWNRCGVRAHVIHCGVEIPSRVADPSREPASVYAVARDVPKKHLRRLFLAYPNVDWERNRSRASVLAARFDHQIFALPCRVATDGDRDGIPVSMMEAMAAGVPVVTRPVAGIGELVDDTTGFIGVDFEAALAAALEQPDERVRRGLAARERIREAFDLTQTVSDLVRLWGRLRS